MKCFRPFTALAVLATLFVLVSVSAGRTQDAVKIAFTPTAAAGGIFNAQAEGFFLKNGLKSTELLTQANGVGVVAAVQSGSAQFGSVAAGVFFGAIENGLDYVAVGCQSLFGPGTDVLAVISRNDVSISKATDFEGKRVAVPGLQGGHHLAFLIWLKSNGADAKKITFLEVNHAQQADVLRGKSVDAVVTAEPNVVRITQAGLGKVVSRLNDMKQNFPDAFFIATRAWANAHPAEVAGFQAGLKEGVAFGEANFDKTSANTAVFLKQDLGIVKQAGKQHFCTAEVAKHVNELNTVMLELGLSKKPMDAAKIVWRKPGT
jgi:NitT/TauT family transport system substrate-binding protein